MHPVNAYRDKQRSTMIASGVDPKDIPAHLETRPGRRRWLERKQRMAAATEDATAAVVEANDTASMRLDKRLFHDRSSDPIRTASPPPQSSL